MKYLSAAQIKEAIDRLRPHHPFFGTTYLVMKAEGAPVGKTARFHLDSATAEFLKTHYRAHPKSNSVFRVMRKGTSQKKDWLRPNYASTGLQSINTQTFRDALLHERNDNVWGWSRDYLRVLQKQLPQHTKVPLFHLAVWLYRSRPWPDDAKRSDLVKRITREYFISTEEIDALFNTSVESTVSNDRAFQTTPVKWYEILDGFSVPEDVPPETGGTLRYLEVEAIGPLKHLRIEPSRRLNIFTGDNGLGKTFLLDLAWWALTQDWVDRPAWPTSPAKNDATISFAVGSTGRARPQRANWRPEVARWELETRSPAISGLVLYARVDGSFAVWDPANQVLQGARKFSREDVWRGTDRIEGLLRDWVRWQDQRDRTSAFKTFEAVLRRVSPPDLGLLVCGEPQRIPGEMKEIPTLVHPYGTVPIVFASAGIKRVLTLAYLIVWAWEEHKLQSQQAGRAEERQMVVIIDEVEAHLHPRWQRVILPALMGIGSDLSAELSLQLLVGSHSPLVLASSEPVFNADLDSLFHLELLANGKIELAHIPFDPRGSVDSWLESNVFKVPFPGSPEREKAIREAIALQQTPNAPSDAVRAVHERLKEFLPAEDPFWPRWIFYAEDHGVKQ